MPRTTVRSWTFFARLPEAVQRVARTGQAGRLLSVVFTVRGTLVRVISARDMSRDEGRLYEQA